MKTRTRRFAYALAGVCAGYGGYTAYVQYNTWQWISRRSTAPTQEYEDPQRRFAPMLIHGRYVNPFSEYRHQTLFEFVYCRFRELFLPHPRGSVPDDLNTRQKDLPSETPNFELLRNAVRTWGIWGIPPAERRMTFTWIGQSCAFIQLPAKTPINILTDPMFSNSVVSPHLGPQRLLPPPCLLKDLPKPDVVLVSHDHQDHLDLEAAKELGNTPKWVVPIGVGAHLEKNGITNFVEMSWWTKIPLPNCDPALGYEVACTPAMHWSGRTLLDANKTLWCSFLILKNGKPLFFHAGDTGYADGLFSGIAKVYGKGVRLAMVPCGAYTPRWHLRSQHMNPSEALEVMADMGAKSLVGVHWGTFVMSEEPYTEPRELLNAGAAGQFQDVQAPVFGRTLVYKV